MIQQLRICWFISNKSPKFVLDLIFAKDGVESNFDHIIEACFTSGTCGSSD